MFRILGEQSNLKTDMDIELFRQRDIFLDCREPIIIEQNVCLGFNITILSQSHDKDCMTTVTKRPVIIRKDTFIGSNVLLHNCEIGTGSVVACGSVVRSRDVPPNCLVEGNPARIIKQKVNGVWKSCDIPLPLKSGLHTGKN